MNLSFTNGVISAGFDRLLDDKHLSHFRQLSKSDFLEMLKTHQYGLTFSKNFEQTMLEEEYKHKLFLESLLDKNHLLFEVLYLKFNHLFLSSLLKSYHLNANYINMLEGLTTYKENEIIQYLIFQNDKLIDLDSKVFIDELINLTKDKDAQTISDLVMQVLHEKIETKLKHSDKKLKRYYETYTMIQNILFIVRAKKYNLDINDVQKNILSNSLIDKSILLSYYDKSFAEFGEYLKLHFDGDISTIFVNDRNADFLRILMDKLEVSMSKLLSDFAFDNQTLGLAIYYTVKKREEIIKLKQIYYNVEVIS